MQDVNIDVRLDSDSRMIEGMFTSSAAKKVLRAIGGTDWVSIQKQEKALVCFPFVSLFLFIFYYLSLIVF